MQKTIYIFMLFMALLFTSCADAGKDQTVKSETSVTLDGANSLADVEGEIKKYRWKQVKGIKVKLLGKKSVQATFVAPTVSKKTELVFRLKTVEKDGYISPWKSEDRVSVFVEPVSIENKAPTAIATLSTNTIEEGESINFDASKSTDSDGEIVSYAWSFENNNTILSQNSRFDYVFTTKGTYAIKLKVTDNDGLSASTLTNVTVNAPADTIAPVITLNGDDNITLTQGDAYVELGATALDDVDGNVSVTVSGNVDTAKVGIYVLTYIATDSANNSTSKTRSVNVMKKVVIDKTPPVITLNGAETITLEVGDAYNELGATATDDIDGNVNVTINGTVDTSAVGVYIMTYGAVDNAGNEASLNREINVINKEPQYGVNIGDVIGNTAKFYSQAFFYVSLKSKPEDNVTIPLSSSDTNEGDIVGEKQLVFTPENWNEEQSVHITGKNKNVGEGKQNYKIVLGTIFSDDANYNDLDPSDVALNFEILSLNAPDDKYDFVPTTRKIICLKVNTALGENNLRYNLLEAPKGMSNEEDYVKNPCLEWKAPVEESGTTHTVRVEVTDGTTKKEISFEIHVANTVPLQSTISGDSVTITEPNSNLNGFRVTRLDKSINLEDIKFRKVVDPYLTENRGIRISDRFIVENLILGDIRVTLPKLNQPILHGKYKISLFGPLILREYNYKAGYHPINGESKKIEISNNSIVTLDLLGTGFGEMFMALDKIKSKKVVKQKKIKQLKMFKNNLYGVSCLPSRKDNSSLNYMLQYCSSVNNSDINITVKNFGETSEATLWNGTTIEEMVSWLFDAQKGFKKLSLVYKNKFTVLIENTKTPAHPYALGFVTHEENEHRNTLHLHNDTNKHKLVMQTTAVHEYFHHAQGKTLDRDMGVGKNNVLTREALWLAEGTARWFEDYLYDDFNSYIFKEVYLEQLLSVGLTNALQVYSDRRKKSYQRFAFFKLLQKDASETYGCAKFENIFSNLMVFDRNDRTGMENLISFFSVAECNFGTHLDEPNLSSKASSLKAALSYYQYATVLKKDMTLLDANENTMVAPHPTVANATARFRFKDDNVKKITNSNWDGNNLDVLSILESSVPAYGAKSIKIDYDAIKDLTSDINLSIKTDRPATVIGVRLDINGNTKAGGINDNFHFTTEANVLKEYNLTEEDRVGGLFVTLLNTTDKKINIDELKFEKNLTGVIIDEDAGLMWQDEYTLWNGARTMRYSPALNYCSILKLANYTDWRIPTELEFTSLYNSNLVGHYGRYWVSKPVPSGGRAYLYGMDRGALSPSWSISIRNRNSLRCVRTK